MTIDSYDNDAIEKSIIVDKMLAKLSDLIYLTQQLGADDLNLYEKTEMIANLNALQSQINRLEGEL